MAENLVRRLFHGPGGRSWYLGVDGRYDKKKIGFWLDLEGGANRNG